MGRPYEVTCIRYYYGIFPRYKDEYICTSKILTHVSNQYLLYKVRTSVERSGDGRMFGGYI